MSKCFSACQDARGSPEARRRSKEDIWQQIVFIIEDEETEREVEDDKVKSLLQITNENLANRKFHSSSMAPCFYAPIVPGIFANHCLQGSFASVFSASTVGGFPISFARRNEAPKVICCRGGKEQQRGKGERDFDDHATTCMN